MNYSRLGFIILLAEGFLPYILVAIFGIELVENHKVITIVYFLLCTFLSPFILEPMIFQDRNPFKKDFK